MRTSIFKFIAEPENGKVYKNSFKIDGKDFVLNTHLDGKDKDLLQCQGVVLHAPLKNPLSVQDGDRIVVQHNTFRVWTDIEGKTNHGTIVNDGEYMIDPSLVYAYNRGKEWYSTGDWIYLTPEKFKMKGIIESRETIRPDRGTVAFKQDAKFEDSTLKVGDKVTFVQGRKVTSTIDGETYLRVRKRDILLTHE